MLAGGPERTLLHATPGIGAMHDAGKGLIAALVVAGVTVALPGTMRLPLLAGLLWLTVGIYLGMALMDSERQTGIQLLGALPVIVLLLLSISTPVLLVVAWLVHPVWDGLHHLGIIRTRIHPATVPFCIVFDVVVAGLTFAVWQGTI